MIPYYLVLLLPFDEFGLAGTGEEVQVPTYGKTCSVLAFAHRSPQAFAPRSVQTRAPQSVTAVECCK